MLAFSYSECGLNVDQFFNLSFYEWSLEVYKVSERRKKEFSQWEGDAFLAREVMAVIMESAGKVYKGKVDPTKIFPLSFDKKSEARAEPLTSKEMKEKLGTKFRKDG